MNLHEQREAVLAALAKAKRGHRPTAELQRKLQIITAGILADEIALERERHKKMIPPRSLELCSEADPELWATFCSACNRPPDPSQVWTVFDVLLWFARKHLEGILAGDSPSRLSH